MGAEAKIYLQKHSIPQLFEVGRDPKSVRRIRIKIRVMLNAGIQAQGLMTGLIYNRPADPLDFLEKAIRKLRETPQDEMSWDMFVKRNISSAARREITSKRAPTKHKEVANPVGVIEDPGGRSESHAVKTASRRQSTAASAENAMPIQRAPSVMKASEVAHVPDVPVILFIGGPGGGKTRHAAKVSSSLAEEGLVHICMPEIIRNALNRYKDKFSEWKEANENYMRGELIPNHLALALVKAEIGRHRNAKAFFLEGFPREARQVEDFERQVKTVNMALIIDYDEKTLRDHMERRGLGMEIIDQKIKEFKQKTLPSAKYFDDQKLLFLIPGEKDDKTIFDRMKSLVVRAMEAGIPVLNSNPPSQIEAPSPKVLNKTPSPSVVLPQPSPVETPLSMKDDADLDELPPPPLVTPDHEKENQSRQSSAASAAKKPPTRPSSRKSTGTSSKRSAGPKRETTPKPVEEVREHLNPIVHIAPPTAASVTPEPVVSEEPVPKGLPNNAPVVLIVGAPGSQKSEIAQRAARKYDGFVLLSMGELLRRKLSEERNDELWQKIGAKMDRGETIPTTVCSQLLYREMHKIGQTSWGYIIEGYPRTQAQLSEMEDSINRIDLAILVDCTEQWCEEIVKKQYEQNKTDRPDNAPELFKSRLAQFKQNTLPMLKYLDQRSKLQVVDGDDEVDTVFKYASQCIDSTLFIEEDDGSGHSLDESKKGSLNE